MPIPTTRWPPEIQEELRCDRNKRSCYVRVITHKDAPTITVSYTRKGPLHKRDAGELRRLWSRTYKK